MLNNILKNGPISPRLLRVNVDIIALSICNGKNAYNGLIKRGMLCAGVMTGGRDACQVFFFLM